MNHRELPPSEIPCISAKIRKANCQRCVIHHNVLFSGLELSKLTVLLDSIANFVSTPKSTIYHQGQEAHGIFTVRQGFVKLTQFDHDGTSRIVRLIGPGNCFGLESLLGKNYQHTAEAITEVDYCRLPNQIVFQIEKEQPQIFVALEKQWQLHIEKADYWLNKLSTGTIQQRMLNLIQMLHDIQQLPDNRVHLLSNRDIAHILAVKEETVSRALAELRQKNMLQRIEKRLYQVDSDILETT